MKILLQIAIIPSKDTTHKGCVTLVALPFTLRCFLRQKNNYGNSNIFHSAKIYRPRIFKKNPRKETKKILQDIITL